MEYGIHGVWYTWSIYLNPVYYEPYCSHWCTCNSPFL